MTTAEIADLPIGEKLQMMEALWAALAADGGQGQTVPAWHADEVAERVGRLRRGEESVSPWAEAKARIRGATGNATA